MSDDINDSPFSAPVISRRAIFRVAAGAVAGQVLASWPPRLGATALAAAPAAPSPEGATDIPANVLLDPSQLVEILARPGDKPAVICVGFRFLYDGGHIPGALYRGPAQAGAGIVSLGTWAGSQKAGKPIVIYCGCCPWNVCPNIEPAYTALRQLNMTNVKVLRINQNFGADWATKGYPTEKAKGAK
jgi:thiosulfate/3-mercaptopyruvate sulfurtransferase